MLFEKLWQNGQKWYWSVIGWICFIRRFWKRNNFGFFRLRGKKVFSMHKLKTYVSESIVYGNDNFSSWLLIPSRPDDFFSPASICIWLVCRNHVEDLSTHIHLFLFILHLFLVILHLFLVILHFFLAILIILTQTGNDYWKHLQLDSSGRRQKQNDVLS